MIGLRLAPAGWVGFGSFGASDSYRWHLEASFHLFVRFLVLDVENSRIHPMSKVESTIL